MASSQRIISALHANWWLNLVGLLLSFAASVALVRTMAPSLYAEYGAVIAMMGVATLVFEAGANSGLTRYLKEAGDQQARGTFYLRMQRRRWLAAAGCALALVTLGPVYARHTDFARLAAQPWLFALIAIAVATTLSRLLAHYGLLALFETRTALLLQQGFQILRSVALAVIALAGGRLVALVGALAVIAAAEALWVHRRLVHLIGSERGPLPTGFLNRAQKFGLLTIFDKTCAMLGSGTVLLLVLAPNHPATIIAFLALAVDLVGKLVSLAAMPMGNLVAPYLSHTSDDAEAQGIAAGRVLKLSSLLYSYSIGLGLLMLPWFVGAVYGERYRGAVMLAAVLMVPTAFENWIRGACSPALLRNGRYRELVRVNVLQAVLTIATLALVREQRVEIVIAAVGGVRSAVAAINLLLLRRAVPAGAFRVAFLGALTAVVGCAAAYAWSVRLPLPPFAQALASALLFSAIFYAGLRWLVFRDEDTLRLAHRVAGTRLKLPPWLLPTPALPRP
jgi:O-antigen/teichoic acid export membrane protein